MNDLQKQFEERGFATKPFSQELRALMLSHIDAQIRELGHAKSLEEIAEVTPDDVWSEKMSRCFRIFPKEIADQIHLWAHDQVRGEFGRSKSAVNVVYPKEVEDNPKLDKDNLAIYWRCVRPGKPDAGRPHRDASFWDLEFQEGYDPKIPFPFNYLKDCIKIWIPLYGCTPVTTLQVIPFSHKKNIPTIVEQTEYGRRPSICPEWLKKSETDFISPIELSQGSCILFDMNLVHRGPRHNHSKLRMSAELNFIVQ